MRILHTSDWHLGRILHGLHLTDDQSFVLAQLVDLAGDERVDAVVIAGDIYDRAVPPPEAVSLLSETLSRLSLDLKIPVLMIAGNHDSPDRLHFGSRLLARANVHSIGVLDAQPQNASVVLYDEHGPVDFYLVPYIEPPVVRQLSGESEIHSHDAAWKYVNSKILAAKPPGRRSVMITHAFVAGGLESESERPLSVGGSGMVDSAAFKGFDYVALGHLHRPQESGAANIRYSGSLMKYSFSEANQEKSVVLIDMDREGNVRTETRSLSVRRDLREISGYLNELLQNPERFGAKDDFLSINLKDEAPVFDAMGRLRLVFPNVLQIQRPALSPRESGGELRRDHRKVSDLDLFASFYNYVTNQEPDQKRLDTFAAAVNELRSKVDESPQELRAEATYASD